MKLSNRLMEIINLIPHNSIVGDVGTDHGYIPAYLIENNISKYVIATDISKGSLQKAVDYAKELNLEEKIETRLGNGLEVYKPFEVDTLIIAGMGGLLIRDILNNNLEITNSITNFIFQPMIAGEELREYLLNNNFKIVKESLAREDNKFYEIIYAKRGLQHIGDDIYYEIGISLIEDKHPLLEEFLKFKINAAFNILKGLDGVTTEKAVERSRELLCKIEKYKEVLEQIES